MPTRAIKAIFYTRFHHEKGNRVLHQVPAGSITPSAAPSALPTPLFPFSSVTQYLIPTQQFCDRLLTFCVNQNRVIGYPVCIREGKYSRNEFIFNFALVIGEDERDWACYGEVVRKLGRLLRGLEEQGNFLSKEEEGVWDDDSEANAASIDHPLRPQTAGFGSKVYALCEMVLEDLNNYAECMIPIDESNTINLKLFPTRPPPPPILAHQVPLLTISLASLQPPISSDLTFNRIVPYINGINPIVRIAQLADTDLSLTRRAIQHLVYYGCLVLLDIFSFSAIYALTAEINGFITDEDVKEECARYVRIPRIKKTPPIQHPRNKDHSTRTLEEESDEDDNYPSSELSSSPPQHDPGHGPSLLTPKPSENDPHADPQEDSHLDTTYPIDHETLITLYTSLRQGFTLKNWVLENLDLLGGIDVRRFITFGIIKGFIYRVHKYAISTSTALPPAPPTSLQTSAATSVANPRESDTTTIRAGLHRVSLHGVENRPLSQQQQQQHQQQHQQHPTISLQRPSVATNASQGIKTQQRGSGHVPVEPEGLHDLGEGTNNGENGLRLLKFMDGMHCFDEICGDLHVPEKTLEARLRSMGEGLAIVVHR